MLKDKLKQIKNVKKSFFEQKSIQIWPHQTESGEERSTGRSSGRDLYRDEAKQSKIIDWL